MHYKVVEVKIDLEKAEKIIKRAISIINKGMPESNKYCEYCKWRYRE